MKQRMLCIQCAMKALLDGKPPPMFDETNEEHMQRYHPDPVAAYAERIELEARLDELREKQDANSKDK